MTSITIPGSASIGDYAFSGCSGLRSITLEDGVGCIFEGAFSGCTGLTSIEIPLSVAVIDPAAFAGCSGLEEVHVEKGNRFYYSNSNCIIETNTDTLVAGCKNSVIPECIVRIEEHAFDGCTGLTSIDIPLGVTSIGSAAFSGCTELTSINIPQNVTSIGTAVFAGCSRLTEVHVEKNNRFYHSNSNCIIETSTDTLVAGCKNSVIPKYVARIAAHAFAECSGLTNIDIPESVTSIGDSAFYECTNLEGVWYSGSEAEKDNIIMGAGNTCLENAIWHFNACKEHTYSNNCDSTCNECDWTRLQNAHDWNTVWLTNNNVHWIECKECGAKKNEENHNGGTATCKEKAICTVCDKFYGDYESHKLTHHPRNEADHNNAGNIEYWTCNVCGKYFSDENGGTVIAQADTVITKIPHSHSTSWSKNEVQHWHECGCGNKIDIVNHCVDNDCDTSCDICGYIRTITHDWSATWSSDTKGHWLECKECGAKKNEENHNGGTATCKEKATCKVCDESYGDYGSHKLTNHPRNNADHANAGNIEYWTCGVCNKYFSDANGSNVITQTDTVIAKVSHSYSTSWSKNASKHWHECKECGDKSKVQKHTWDNGAVTKQAGYKKTGTKTYTCTVCGKTKTEQISAISSMTLSTTEYTYNGSKKTPAVTVKDSKGKELISGTDYKLTYSSSTRKSIGRYSAKITFKGNYSGSKTLYFTIGPKNPTSVKATLYGHDDVKVTWSKVSGASGYKVYYKKSTASTWSSKTTTGTSIKLKNLADGVKYNIRVVTYKTKGEYKCYNAGKSTSIYTLKKITDVKAKKSGTKVKISWTNISGETGYQISQSTKKSGTNIVATYKTTSGKYKTVSAAKGKTYYYKVRAYKVVNGKKIYSPWSTVVNYVRK